jgi:hypothetical protein
LQLNPVDARIRGSSIGRPNVRAAPESRNSCVHSNVFTQYLPISAARFWPPEQIVVIRHTDRLDEPFPSRAERYAKRCIF